MALAELGYLNPEEFDPNLIASIERTLQKFPCPSPAATDLTVGFMSNWYERMELEPESTHGVAEGDGAITIACERTDYEIGAGVEALEQAHAGLGQTVLHALYRAGRETLGLIDPPLAWDLIGFQHWYGMNNSAEAKEEAKHSGASPEEIREIITEETIYQTYPKWSFAPQPIQGFDTLRLPCWLEKARLKLTEVFRVEDVIQATRELRRLVTGSRIENEISRVACRSALRGPFWIMWRAADMATDAVDYQWQYEGETGETHTDLAYVKFLKWGDVPATRDALREIAAIGAIVKKMEELILLIGNQL